MSDPMAKITTHRNSMQDYTTYQVRFPTIQFAVSDMVMDDMKDHRQPPREMNPPIPEHVKEMVRESVSKELERILGPPHYGGHGHHRKMDEDPLTKLQAKSIGEDFLRNYQPADPTPTEVEKLDHDVTRFIDARRV